MAASPLAGRTYTLADLQRRDFYDAKEEAYIQERIDAQNRGERRFNFHTGVGGAFTMDAPLLSGGGGRGNARVQFLRDSIRIVDHSDKDLR